METGLTVVDRVHYCFLGLVDPENGFLVSGSGGVDFLYVLLIWKLVFWACGNLTEVWYFLGMKISVGKKAFGLVHTLLRWSLS